MTLSVAPMPHDGSHARALRGGKFCSLYFLEWDLLLGATCDVKRATDPDSIDDEGGDSIFFFILFCFTKPFVRDCVACLRRRRVYVVF